MAKYNSNHTKAEAALEAVKEMLRREPQVIPKSKWDQMVLEVAKSRNKIKALKIGVLISVLLNVAAIVWLLK